MTNFLKNWLIKQLTEVSAWVAVAIMIAAFFRLPYDYFFIGGVVLLLLDEAYIIQVLGKISPSLKAKIDSWK